MCLGAGRRDLSRIRTIQDHVVQRNVRPIGCLQPFDQDVASTFYQHSIHYQTEVRTASRMVVVGPVHLAAAGVAKRVDRRRIAAIADACVGVIHLVPSTLKPHGRFDANADGDGLQRGIYLEQTVGAIAFLQQV